MAISDCGRHCSKCDVVVHDFSNTQTDKIKFEIQRTGATRGNFRAINVIKPFGNWKDYLIGFYQNAESRLNNQRILKPVVLFFLMGLLFMAGCRSSCKRGVVPNFSAKTTTIEQSATTSIKS